MPINTIKNFMTVRWKWVQTFLVCFLIASPCFSEENLNQPVSEYWIKLFEKEGTNLDLTKYIYSYDDGKTFIEELKKNPSNLKGLRIGYKQGYNEKFNKWLCENVMEALLSNKTLTSIEFIEIPLELNKLVLLVLKENKTLETVKLDCKFNDEEIVELVNILRSNLNLKEIHLKPSVLSKSKLLKKLLKEVEEERNSSSWLSSKQEIPLSIKSL